MNRYKWTFDIELFKSWGISHEGMSPECMEIVINNSNWIKLDGRERRELQREGNPILLSWCRRVDTEKGE